VFSNFKVKIKNFLQNVRSKPESEKKKILWTIVAVAGVILFVIWWVVFFQKALKNLTKEKFIKTFNIEELQERIGSVPAVKMPDISAEDLRKLEEEAQGLETQNNLSTGE